MRRGWGLLPGTPPPLRVFKFHEPHPSWITLADTPSDTFLDKPAVPLSSPACGCRSRRSSRPPHSNSPGAGRFGSGVEALGVPVEVLKQNRLSGLRGADERETYNRAKRTLAVVTAAPGAFKLQPIPPSADWQFHLAEGCPAHCQYCYLAGSLAGPPVIRAFANLPDILDNLPRYETPGAGRNEAAGTTFEASCYTDPLSLEHLTGSLAETIRWFGTREHAYLRYTTKFDAVEQLLDLPHNGHTRPSRVGQRRPRRPALGGRRGTRVGPLGRAAPTGPAPVRRAGAATRSAWSSRRSSP